MNDYRNCFLIILLLASPPLSATTLSTWAPWEVDSATTAWYLKRYVMPDVKFESVAKGVLIERELSIDIPDSPYQRDARNTALDSAIDKHAISFVCIEKLTTTVRLLELAPWRKSISPEAVMFEQDLFSMLPKQPMVGGLEQVFSYLDRYCTGDPLEK